MPPAAAATGTPLPPAAAAPPPGALSEAGQRVYARAADKLVQIRILLNGVRSKSEAGSGFYVSADGLVVTNYHVISRLALEPQRYQAEVVATDGTVAQGALVAFDAPQDLAILKVDRKAGAFFPLLPPPAAAGVVSAATARPAPAPTAVLVNGQRIFSLGNPLDLGFAIAEGTYNGLIEQHFYAQILFTGALNPGMSGGPALDADGRVIGINVAKRLDGELTSFLIPVQRARALLERALAGPSGVVGPPGRATVTEQLMAHQQRVTERLLAAALPLEPIGTYQVPVSPGEWIRCWASRSNNDEAYIQIETNRCAADSGVYVSDQLDVGEVRYQHDFGSSASGLRFLRRHTEGFAREPVGRRRGNQERGATRCTEDYVQRGPGTLRVVMSAAAYRRLPGLYDFTLAAASVDRANAGLQTRLEAQGFSYDNGLRIARHFLAAVQWARPAGVPVPPAGDAK